VKKVQIEQTSIKAQGKTVFKLDLANFEPSVQEAMTK
jgi:hypothetical protein